MSTLWIKEHDRMPQQAGGPQIWTEPCLVEQTPVTYTGTAGQSAAFNAQTKAVTITSDGTFSYLIASNPTATTSNFRVAAGEILTIAVDPTNPGLKISAITVT